MGGGADRALHRPQRRGQRLEPAQLPRQRRGAPVLSRRDDVVGGGRQPGLPGRQEHGRGTAAAFRDGGHDGVPGGVRFGHNRTGRVAHLVGRTRRQRRAGVLAGEQPQPRQEPHAPCVMTSRARRRGIHPPGQRRPLSAGHSTACARDGGARLDVDSIAHARSEVTEVMSGEQARSGPASTAYLANS